jgi:expansin (peptidoglycan-binding protein)
VRTGAARFYAANGSGACGFPRVPRGEELLVAAVNDADWDDSGPCGACARVSGPEGEVVVRIVDRCRGCPDGGLDLSPQAFDRIASRSDGKAAITWSLVACDVPDVVTWHVKPGSHRSWMALQVRDARYAVASVEVAQGDAWIALERTRWNEFVGKGLGEGPFRVRATDVHGQAIEDTVPLADGAHAGTAQFGACR